MSPKIVTDVPVSGTPAIPAVEGNCWTIAKTVDSPVDYLNNARAWVKLPRNGVSTTAGAHLTAVDAAKNLVQCAHAKPKGASSIVGHGTDGRIITGTGLYVETTTEYMCTGNADAFADALGKPSSLYLLGCNVGADTDGLDLLVDLVKLLGCECHAPVGWIDCFADTGFALEPGTWLQSVYPGQEPPGAIPAPSYNVGVSVADWAMVLASQDVIRVEMVSSVTLVHPSGRSRAISGSEAQNLMRTIDVVNPLPIRGGLGSVVTGSFRIEYRTDGNKTKTAEFLLLNNRVIKNVNEHSYYRCDRTFAGTAFGFGER